MKLFYRKYGNGQPLIILHGLFGSSDNWVSIAKQLENEFTIYLPDLRNHGLSPHSSIHDYDSMRDDLYELVEDIRPGRFFLAGHSMGGKAAMKFAMKWPELLQGLLVADISPFENQGISEPVHKQHSAILEAILSADISSATSREEADTLLAEGIPAANIRSLVMKNLRRNDDKSFSWKLNARALKENLHNIMSGIDRQTYMRQQVTGFPVIFLKGEKSNYIPAGDLSDIRKLFPAAEIVTVKGAGHWVNADNPAEVIKNLRRLKEA